MPTIPTGSAVIAISVGLLSQVFLIKPLGFVISAAILFFARRLGASGSRKCLRDAIVAIILSLVTYLGLHAGCWTCNCRPASSRECSRPWTRSTP